MDYTKGEWKADERVGVVAVYADNESNRNCLDGESDNCIYWGSGYQEYNEDGSFKQWNVSPEKIANAHLIAESPAMYKALKQVLRQREYETQHMLETDPMYLNIKKILNKVGGKNET